jgi:hypothetical protein
MAACFFTSARNQIHPRMTQLNQQIRIASARLTPCRLVSPSTQLGGAGRPPSGTPNPWQANPNFLKRTKSGGRKRLEEASGGERARALPMSSVSHHLLHFPAGCSDVDDAGPFTVALPSFWPPFPALSSNSNVPSFLPRRTDRSREAAAASAFFGLGFHDVDDDEWAPPDEGVREVELPLCWDCLHLEDHDDHHQRWDVGDSDADEWEQVVGREEEPLGGRVLLATNSLGSLSVDECSWRPTAWGASRWTKTSTGASRRTSSTTCCSGNSRRRRTTSRRARAAGPRRRPPWRASQRWWSRRPTRPACRVRCARTASRPVSVHGGCRARTSTTTDASSPGSPSAARARSAATSCPPMTPSARSARRGGPPPAVAGTVTASAGYLDGYMDG